MVLKAHNEETKGHRTIYIDLLRIAATIGVIMGHAVSAKWYDSPVTSFNWQIMNVYDSSVNWIVPIFVMISGIFHLRPISGDTTFKTEIQKMFKKVLKIIYAIIFWGILYNLFDLLVRYFMENEPITLYGIARIFVLIIFGPAYFHFWFLYMLIGLYLLTPVFRCIINNCKKEHLEYFLVLFFIFGAFIPVINIILPFFSFFKGKTIYFPVPELTGYMGYYIAGYYFANYKIKQRTRNGIYVLAVLSVFFTIIVTSFISVRERKPFEGIYGFLTPNTMFIAYAVFLLFQDKFTKMNISDGKIKIISKISKDTFGIYLIHIFVLKALDMAGINILMMNPIVSIPVITIVVLILSAIGIIIINKIPILSKNVI